MFLTLKRNLIWNAMESRRRTPLEATVGETPRSCRSAKLRKLSQTSVWIVAGLVAGFSLTGFLGDWWWMFDLTCHFRSQYAALLLVCGGVGLLLGMVRHALVCGVFAALNLTQIVPLYWPAGADPTSGKTWRLVHLNLYYNNPTPHKALHFLEEAQADVVVLSEITPALEQELAPLHAVYGYRQAVVHEGGRGIALWSRSPWDQVEIKHFVSEESPAVAAVFPGENRPWTLLGVHAPWPLGNRLTTLRNQEFQALARWAATLQSSDLVVLGDLNCTSWSSHFGDLLHRSGLRDGRQGFGLRPTWPAWFWPLSIPIDHCLISKELLITRHEVGPDVGSDHFPLVVEFAAKRPETRRLKLERHPLGSHD